MAEDAGLPADIREMSFEKALKELEDIVRQLEQGQVELDDAIRHYERGAQLKRHCEDKLKEAKGKIERITVAADGTPGTEPADQDPS